VYVKTRNYLPVLLLVLAGCGEQEAVTVNVEPSINDGVFVQMFEWRWTDLARECEEHLGPAGYAAVQTSPPNEHIPGPQWWTRYQPVSYLVESRSGTREEFAAMVARCRAAGVDVYADAIINHMADVGVGKGVAGSEYTEFSYPVPYGYDEFHRCGRNEDNSISDYQDKWEVQNCQLGGLADLDTGRPSVQAKIGAYLNDLLALGVAGFRLDAVKHMAAEDVSGILAQVEGEPFIVQEVIDRGGEPIKAREYVEMGHVTEFRYASALIDAFKHGEVTALNAIGSKEWLDSSDAVVFIDNHDSQRSHLGDNILNYKDGAVYDLATVFMLAYPYGYPMLMSSFAFGEDDDPVPTTSPHDEVSGCGADWVCEHRRPTATAMVSFRKATRGLPVAHWRASDDIVSFSRGDLGHVIINAGSKVVDLSVGTALPNGEYIDRLGKKTTIVVEGGQASAQLGPQSALVVLAKSPDPDPERFAAAIAAFVAWDSKNSFPEDAFLFVGSSSIRLWSTAEAFPDKPVINRGFGGSEISDVIHFYEQLIRPYAPRSIFLYAGDNDIGNGKPAAQVFEDYRELVALVQADFPGATLVFISIKPSKDRWDKWPIMEEANRMVRDFASGHPNLEYADLATPLLDDDSKPKDVYVEDGLHLNEEGYRLWQEALAPFLD